MNKESTINENHVRRMIQDEMRACGIEINSGALSWIRKHLIFPDDIAWDKLRRQIQYLIVSWQTITWETA